MILPIAGGEAGTGGFLRMIPMISFEKLRVRAALSVRVWPALAVALTGASSGNALAASMDEMVVSATRTEQRFEDVLADVTILDREKIEKSGSGSVAELLSRQPGIQMTSNGGPATTTNVFIRGASTQYTAVYLDGVRLDSQVTSGGVTWQSIPLALIDHVEILRGSAAAVYGSDAVAGVILLTTKKGEGVWAPHVAVGYGTHGTFRADAGMSGSLGVWDYNVAVVREGSQGFDAQPEKALSNDEGYGRAAVNASLGLQMSATQSLRLHTMRSQTHSDYVPSSATADHQYHRTQETLGATWVAKWSPMYKTTVSASTSQDKYTLQPSGQATDAKLHNYLWQNDFKLPHNQRVSATFERREDSLVNPSVQQSSQQKRHQNALALGYGIAWDKHSLQLNARRDIDSEFGGKNTAGLAYAWNFAPGWSASASTGTSFRVPTLYQRFYKNTDASLQPEKGRNKELSLRWVEGDNHFSATAYRNKLHNMIKYSKEGVQEFYRNVDRAVLEGITLAGAYRTGAFKWHGSVDFQNPRDDNTTGHLLERRSKRFMTVGVDTMVAGTEIGAEIYAASRRFNGIKDAEMTLAGYTLIHLTASREITKDFTLTARIDNLFDRDYTLAKGYATAGRTVFVGLKWSPQ